MNDAQLLEYINGLQVGEIVIETGRSCMTGQNGTVYISKNAGVTLGSKCVMWQDGMGTSVTAGTRRLREVLDVYRREELKP